MLYRRFGRTEIRMPVFSCGGMRYQESWNSEDPVSDASQRNLETTIERALEVGITHIETARGYGTSEQQLGRVLPRLPRERIIVQTKVPPKPSPRKFRAAFLDSLARLGLDHVDLLAIHGVNTAEHVHDTLRPRGCLAAALELRDRGHVRHVGFSTHAPVTRIADVIGSGGFDYVNLHWYYIFQDNLPAIEAAAARDMGVFIISPSDKGGMLYKPPRLLEELCAPLSPIQFNDVFCLSEPRVHTLSIGAARPGDFDEHLAALRHLDDPEPVLAPILARLEERFDEALGREFAASWKEGIPEWDALPGGVNVRTILWLRNLALAYDMRAYGAMRYALLGGNGGHWMPGNRADAADPDALRAALQASPHAGVIPDLLREAHELLAPENPSSEVGS